MSLPTRKIGDTEVSSIGYGAMGISAYYGTTEPDEERFKVLDAAHAKGCTFWDTADVYADSEDLIGNWFKRTGKRNDIFLATKFGFRSEPGRLIDGRPEYVKQAFEKSLSRLGVDHIDLYYLHRADTTVPIEHTVGAMAELVKAGKVKYLGLSECSAATLRRAHAVHPISAVQVEYSPFTLDIEDEQVGLLKAARELGITIVAYSPLGRGLLTGQFKSPDDFEENDFRRAIPRYSKENFPKILKLAEGLKRIGEKYGATAGQVALAWLLAQGDDIIPIPGTKKIKYLEENLVAAKIQLTPTDLNDVRAEAKMADTSNGPRYPVGMGELLFANTPELGV
jgi:aryl-alcohol dehydrogenase-like predicted oxidoreductase